MKKRKYLRPAVIAFALALSVLLSGCGTNKTVDASADGVYTVVTSFYPIYIDALNVAGGIDGVKVVNMTKPSTGCLHDYQFTTGDLKTLEKADAFVINGAGMETFMIKVTGQLPGLHVIDSSTGIDLIKDSSGEVNGHIWVSVSNAITQVGNIADGLGKADPAHAEQFESNAQAYITKLQDLKQQMHAALYNVPNKNIIPFHEAFSYFAKEFNLSISAVIERDPGTAPTPAELEDTINIINKSGCKTLFAEPQYSSSAAKTIAAETGAKIYSLDPAVTGPDDSDAYINIMTENLKQLKEALG